MQIILNLESESYYQPLIMKRYRVVLYVAGYVLRSEFYGTEKAAQQQLNDIAKALGILGLQEAVAE